jgi:hypothetical protein
VVFVGDCFDVRNMTVGVSRPRIKHHDRTHSRIGLQAGVGHPGGRDQVDVSFSLVRRTLIDAGRR